MPFLQFTLDIGARDPAPYEDALFAAGASSVTLLDAADNPVLEPAPGATPLWPTVIVRALFAMGSDADHVRQALLALPEIDTTLVRQQAHFERVADRAWEREWLKDFRPMRFGRRLWVCPGGQSPDAAEAADARELVLLQLDPGLAFGTGTHATTALCLEWLDSGAGSWLADAEVIDYGCGSGILAIAALRLGARIATAMDIDPQALLATRENAGRNDVLARLQVTDDREVNGARADVVLANILAGPLVELAPVLAACTGPGGRIALSGLLLEQADAVTAAYLPWFDIGLTGAREGWGLLTGCRRAQAIGREQTDD
jgi:ribosomal protein L11 methyltransferase